MENSIGIHYQTWKNKTAVEKVLSNLRIHYPNVPVRMVSDAGDDFSDLAKKYDCQFDYETENIFPRGILIGHPVWKKEVTYYGAKVWLKRLYETCKRLDTKWVIIFEDDVLTVNTIKEFPITTAASKDCSPYRESMIRYLMSKENVIKDYCWYGYGMVGGSIIHRQFVIDSYEKYINDIDFNFLSNLDERTAGWSDILLNVFVVICGGTYSTNWIGMAGNLKQNPNAAFLHGDKEVYDEAQGSTYKIETDEV